MLPPLNWREIALLIEKLKPLVEGRFVDRVFIPERRSFPIGYLKSEFALRISGQKQESMLIMSVRAQNPYLTWTEGKGHKAAAQATHAAFDLMLSKILKGLKILKIEALHQERMVLLWFNHPEEPANKARRLGLILKLIPARPEAVLVSTSSLEKEGEGWPILARSRPSEAGEAGVFTLPNGFQAPQNPPVREELLRSPSDYFYAIEKALNEEAFQLRTQAAVKILKQTLKLNKERYAQSHSSLKQAEKQSNWQRWADLLKGSIGVSVERTSQGWIVEDFETGSPVEVPADPQLTLVEQVRLYYEKAKKNQRKLQEVGQRSEDLKAYVEKIEKILSVPPAFPQWEAIEKLEAAAGITSALQSSTGKSALGKSAALWQGKSFLSQDGFLIFVGRNKTENAELTFKVARGNDIWLHVRGRPGAHGVIPIPTGKSAPLDTLLDAAHLTLYYSNGKDWGKTEIDYTFKKYVKRIKGSTEVSYTNNKTLMITPDAARLKRLLESF